jgi:hypothetical protein
MRQLVCSLYAKVVLSFSQIAKAGAQGRGSALTLNASPEEDSSSHGLELEEKRMEVIYSSIPPSLHTRTERAELVSPAPATTCSPCRSWSCSPSIPTELETRNRDTKSCFRIWVCRGVGVEVSRCKTHTYLRTSIPSYNNGACGVGFTPRTRGRSRASRRWRSRS